MNELTITQRIMHLEMYIRGLDNHKLERPRDKKWYIIRKSKNYAFKIDFNELYELGFRPLEFTSHNGKDILVIELIRI